MKLSKTIFSNVFLIFFSCSLVLSASAHENADPKSITTYSADGTVQSVHEYEYDQYGNKTALHLWVNQTAGDGWTHTEYEYNSDGECSASSSFKDDGSAIGTRTYEYSEDGKTLTAFSYNNEGQLVQYTVDEFDEHDNLLKEEQRWADDSLIASYEYQLKYDADGKKESAVRKDNTDADTADAECVLIKYEWDSNDNLILEQEYQEDELVSYTEYTY